MLPNKYGYWYIFGLILASALTFLPILGDFIGFFITSMAITAIFHNKKKKHFKSKEILEIAATCSVTIFLIAIIFFILFIQNPNLTTLYILLVAIFTRFIAVSGGIWTYNKLIKLK